MTISISRYINISSEVLGAAVVSVRELILNIFTVNPLVPPQTSITFTTLAEVGSYFGTTSEEYYRAQNNYFAWVSKNNTQPTLIQYTRWVQTAVAGSVLGFGGDTTLADWQAVTSGSIGLTIGTHTAQVTGLDFASATSLGGVSPSVVTILEAGINAVTAGGADWTAATVTYANNEFTLTGGVVGPEAIAVQAGGTGTDISGATRTTGVAQLGWLPQGTVVNGVYIPGAIWSQGSAIETITQTLQNSTQSNNNFGTIVFCYTGINSNTGLTLSQYQQAAIWNN